MEDIEIIPTPEAFQAEMNFLRDHVTGHVHQLITDFEILYNKYDIDDTEAWEFLTKMRWLLGHAMDSTPWPSERYQQ